MKISSRERKIFLYSLLFLVISVLIAIFANIWFTFSEAPRTFNILIAGYSIGFLGFSFLCSIAAGKFLSRLRLFDALAALTIYIIFVLPSNYMFWLLLGVLIKKLPPVLLDLVNYTDGKQFAISIISTLVVLIGAALWFFLAKKRRRNQKISNPSSKH